ncbi:ribosome assembly RNA-binding protein YhbY [Methylonatrum kenyense]|uniref:ribosome assembly RNA-binding protein YhbY n=1 Tax=Methylonatrum kenyense TaxID=455253 RepID=UPI0020BEEB30|nr:ribosome assembly RNA-binding protein YhbY [Methylonatrum kenyense]MCK8515899.1 ribosome assembly RNA-binding protein YhbY [Methylonatrum kenyense]
MKSLNEDQKRHLRRLGHALKPVVLMGAGGLSDGVMAEIDQALDDHELIKVKLVADDRTERRELGERISREQDAALVQAVGNIILLFRRSRIEKKRRIALP